MGYYVVDAQNRAAQSHSLLIVTIACGQLVTLVQQLGVLGMMSVNWVEPLLSLFSFFQLFAFNLDILRMGCVASMGPLWQFCSSVSAIFVCIAIMCTYHVIFVVVKHRRDFAGRMPSLIGSV